MTASATDSSLFTSPLTREPHSKVSGDFDPINIKPYFSSFASLPGIITPGLWTSASTRHFFENVVARDRNECVLSYDAPFVGMVLLGDKFKVDICRAVMKDGKGVVPISTTNQRGENVIESSAEVRQPGTVYVFTGQGSREPGMGMDLYGSSPAACAVWEGADAQHSFSIANIIKNSPTNTIVHFGGLKVIRTDYILVNGLLQMILYIGLHAGLRCVYCNNDPTVGNIETYTEHSW